MRGFLLVAAFLAAIVCFAGCQAVADSGSHYGYAGSLPGKCTSCE